MCYFATRLPVHYFIVTPQRSNYAEPTSSYLGMDEDDQAGKSAKGRARQTVSDKRQLSGPSTKRKKANMNIRTAILYRKNFATLIEESVGVSFNRSQDTLLISLPRDCQTSPPRYPLILTLPLLPLRSRHDHCALFVGIGATTNAKNVPCIFVVSIARASMTRQDVNDASFKSDHISPKCCKISFSTH